MCTRSAWWRAWYSRTSTRVRGAGRGRVRRVAGQDAAWPLGPGASDLSSGAGVPSCCWTIAAIWRGVSAALIASSGSLTAKRASTRPSSSTRSRLPRPSSRSRLASRPRLPSPRPSPDGGDEVAEDLEHGRGDVGGRHGREGTAERLRLARPRGPRTARGAGRRGPARRVAKIVPRGLTSWRRAHRRRAHARARGRGAGPGQVPRGLAAARRSDRRPMVRRRTAGAGRKPGGQRWRARASAAYPGPARPPSAGPEYV
jgi:hypothetical protein